jgi:DNA-binding NarL/FixJ family response regulator
MPISVFIADDHAVVRDGLRLLLESQADIKVVGYKKRALKRTWYHDS